MKITEEQRAASKEQPERAVMSVAAKEKLRLINDATKATKDANAAFVSSFIKLDKTVPVLMQVLHQAYGRDWSMIQPTQLTTAYETKRSDISSYALLERMATKLRLMVAKGFLPGSSFDTILLASLTPEELDMSDTKFAASMEQQFPVKPSNYLDPNEELSVVQPRRRSKETRCVCETCNELFTAMRRNAKKCPACKGQKAVVKDGVRYCGLGKACLRFDNRKPGIVTGKGDYCSKNCSGAAMALAKRALASQTPKRVDFQTNENA